MMNHFFAFSFLTWSSFLDFQKSFLMNARKNPHFWKKPRRTCLHKHWRPSYYNIGGLGASNSWFFQCFFKFFIHIVSHKVKDKSLNTINGKEGLTQKKKLLKCCYCFKHSYEKQDWRFIFYTFLCLASQDNWG